MVFINGVKYACERCIRGHRVTTCTHTDQPLTMIKPKGRPATQCHHCREQRKSKNLHTQCTCGKKGRTLGAHAVLCVCHKTSHCTCSQLGNRKQDPRKKWLKKSASDMSIPTVEGNMSRITSTPARISSSSDQFVLDDMILPVEEGNGLFEMFDSSKEHANGNGENMLYSAGPSSTSLNASNLTNGNSLFKGPDNKNFVAAPNSVSSSNLTEQEGSTMSLTPEEQTKPINSTPTDLRGNAFPSNSNLTREHAAFSSVENMFPLFPLVGTFSFEDSKNQPLSMIPADLKSKIEYHNNDTNLKSHLNRSVGATFNPPKPRRTQSSYSFSTTTSSFAERGGNGESTEGSNSFTTPAYNALSYSLQDLASTNREDLLNDPNNGQEMNLDAYQQLLPNMDANSTPVNQMAAKGFGVNPNSQNEVPQVQSLNKGDVNRDFKQENNFDISTAYQQDADLDTSMYNDIISFKVENKNMMHLD